jgi:hypothetical protein
MNRYSHFERIRLKRQRTITITGGSKKAAVERTQECWPLASAFASAIFGLDAHADTKRAHERCSGFSFLHLGDQTRNQHIAARITPDVRDTAA